MSSDTLSQVGCRDKAAETDFEKRIERQLEANIYYFARRPDQIEQRLKELDEEWDLERVLEITAGAVGLAGVAMGTLSKRWQILPALAGGFLLQHAAGGWCPSVSIWRRLGVRTAREINQERYALKSLRGDFHAADPQSEPDLQTRVERALEAIHIDATNGKPENV